MELIQTTDTFTVSLENQRSVILTLPWFVSQSKYPPRPANLIEPLINGEKTFFDSGRNGVAKEPKRAACYYELLQQLKADPNKRFPDIDRLCPLPEPPA